MFVGDSILCEEREGWRSIDDFNGRFDFDSNNVQMIRKPRSTDISDDPSRSYDKFTIQILLWKLREWQYWFNYNSDIFVGHPVVWCVNLIWRLFLERMQVRN